MKHSSFSIIRLNGYLVICMKQIHTFYHTGNLMFTSKLRFPWILRISCVTNCLSECLLIVFVCVSVDQVETRLVPRTKRILLLCFISLGMRVLRAFPLEVVNMQFAKKKESEVEKTDIPPKSEGLQSEKKDSVS